LHKQAHTDLGTIVVVLMLLQPFFGIIQHIRFRKTQKQGTWTFVHRWYGRVLIIMGIINGGLGLQLAHNTTKGKIAYSVLGGIMGSALCMLAVFVEARKVSTKQKTETEGYA
jgi:low temperature requirement protein LtrA